MLRKRIIVCLDVRDGRVVKGVGFRDLRDAGDPVEMARRYQQEGADEIVFLDISASAEARRMLLDTVRRTAEQLFIPLTVGGGIVELADVEAALRAGADKISINTAAVRRPELITECAARFGSQCIVASIDALLEKREIEIATRVGQAVGVTPEGGSVPAGSTIQRVSEDREGAWYRVFVQGGQTATDLDAIHWARRCEELGAGEMLITSIDQDGSRDGYDLELTARVAEAVHVPVIASGGAGTAAHIRDALRLAGADAALAAGIFHDGTTTVADVKRALHAAGVPVRLTSSAP